MPSGIEIPDFYIEELHDWVNIIAITKEGLFVIEEQYRHGIQKICFELPAGDLKPGEEPSQAAKRELEEETGYTGGEWIPYGTYVPNASGCNNTCHSFLAIGVEKTINPKLEATEDIQTHLVTIDEIKAMLVDGRVVEGVMQAPLWRYLMENK
jgi:8-oxo-dGTP pyrophosphatase MutT (NUDIX family)